MEYEAAAMLAKEASDAPSPSPDRDHGTGEEARCIVAARTDPEAFATLYARYVTPVYRYLYQQVGQPADAQDLTSTTFTKALAGIARYRGRGTFAAWLFGIARNTLRDYRRRRRPTVDVDAFAETIHDPAPPLDIQQIGAERERLLRRLLARLPDEQREALLLHFVAGLRPTEIAAVQGCRAGAVRMRIHRALATLRRDYPREEQP